MKWLKGTAHSVTRYKGTEGKKRYSPALSLISVLDGGGWSRPQPDRLTPRNTTSTHCTRSWVGPGVGLDGRRKSRPHRGSSCKTSGP